MQAFEQNIIQGKMLMWYLDFTHTSGLHTLTQELRYSVQYWRSGSEQRVHAALQGMLPILADKTVDEVKSLTENYHKYKGEYVKHLCFNPEDENLSKCLCLCLELGVLDNGHEKDKICPKKNKSQPVTRNLQK